jgi:hypothetical protein
VLLVDYEQFLSNFDTAMFCVAEHLGSTRDSFVDIKERVGFYLYEDEGKWTRP